MGRYKQPARQKHHGRVGCICKTLLFAWMNLIQNCLLMTRLLDNLSLLNAAQITEKIYLFRTVYKIHQAMKKLIILLFCIQDKSLSPFLFFLIVFTHVHYTSMIINNPSVIINSALNQFVFERQKSRQSLNPNTWPIVKVKNITNFKTCISTFLWWFFSIIEILQRITKLFHTDKFNVDVQFVYLTSA